MKNWILNSMIILGIVFSLQSCNDDEDNHFTASTVTEERLPETGKSLLNEYFSGQKIKEVKQNAITELDGTLYEVKLQNGIEIDFDEYGNWTEIDGNNTAIPQGLVPTEIRNYVVANYPNSLYITSID